MITTSHAAPETGRPFALRSSPPRRPIVTESARVALLQLLTRADDLIESLITVVDLIRGDADFEPELGAPSQGISRDPTDQTYWATGGDSRDREDDHDFEECHTDMRGDRRHG